MPEKSQVLGQITSDFYTSPFTYSIELPAEPGATLKDVDHNGQTNPGVMIYAVAYWTNTWGDPYLEQRDLFGGGWSTAYASTHIDQKSAAHGEVIGGKYIVFAPDDQEGFPSGFGADKKLFTDDDPIVRLPQGYTVVDMDTDPFTFDRSRNPVIDLIEGEGAAQEDFSSLSYTEPSRRWSEMFREEVRLHRPQAHRLGRQRKPSICRVSRKAKTDKQLGGIPARPARLYLVDSGRAPQRPRR